MCGRIPMRLNEDDRYFTDLVEQMPADGYTAMFERMLDHPGIEIRLHTDYRTISREVSPPSWFGRDRSTPSSVTNSASSLSQSAFRV